MIEQKRPRFHTAYFSVSMRWRAHGPYHRETFATIEALDAMVGTVWQAAVRAAPTNGDASMCSVITGFRAMTRPCTSTPYLRDAGLIELDGQGKLKSWRAIGWGSGAVMLNDPTDNEARRAASAALQKLAASPANGVAKIIDGAEAKTMGGFPDATFVVFVKPGWTVGGSFEAPVGTGDLGRRHARAVARLERDGCELRDRPGHSARQGCQSYRHARYRANIRRLCSVHRCRRPKEGTCFPRAKSD